MTGSLLTATEVAKLLGVPVSWVYEQSRQGRIPTVTLGRYRRYRLDSIEAWVSELETTAQRERLGSTWRERPVPAPRRHAHR